MTVLGIAWYAAMIQSAGSLAEYAPPSYPAAEPVVASVGLQAGDTLQAGATVKVSYRVELRAASKSPLRLFLHVVRDGKVFHVAVFSGGQAAGGAAAELGPFETTLPANLPAGKYTLVGGVYLEKASAEKAVAIRGSAGAALPIIINTGTFVDKAGRPHRWHVNTAHTLYWDGEPFFPVGGMMIPDDNFDTFKAQIDLLAKNNVRDVYFNVGNSIHMPHTWETKGDEKLRYFQKCIDYMDEAGIRYGMEFSGLQAHGYAYDLMGGKEITFRYKEGEKEARLERSSDDEWLKDGVVFAAYRKVREGYYLVTDVAAGKVLVAGKVEIARDERKNREGKDRGEEEQVAKVKLPALPPGEYKLCLSVSQFRDSWNSNMHYWSDDTAKYYKAIDDLYGKVRMGPGFRFVVDAFWNENNFNHGVVPAEASCRARHAVYLKGRYGTIDKLHAAWAVDGDAGAVPDFAAAARLLAMRGIREKASDVTFDYLIDVDAQKLVRVKQSASQHRYDLLESISRQVRDFHIEIADRIKKHFDVPVIFKFFSGTDLWHINDAGIAGGHDGIGMETYGVAEPMLAFMGIPGFGSCRQSTKTMWFIATEIGEGNHQDQAFARNKLFGCTSRLGTMYPIYTSLLSGGAKGIYQYYMVPSPGADRFWDDSTLRDPRQLEWMGTFASIVENAPGLADYAPTAYFRFPALFQPNSGLLYSDPHRDYFNTDCLWWVDPAGKLPNGAWVLPTFTLAVPTQMMFINLENVPASLRYAAEVNAFLARGSRVTWLGYRKDLGTIPAVDRYYTPQMARDDDGVEFQVLKPEPDARVIGKNKAGQVWNFMVGPLQIISKNAENKTGWRPDRVVLDDANHRFDYQRFMKERLGAQPLDLGSELEGITYLDRGRRVTVIALRPPLDKIVRMGEQLPPWSFDATGNTVAPPPMKDYVLTFRVGAGASATYACGDRVEAGANGTLSATLRPDEVTLLNSEGKIPWAREGLLFNTVRSRAAVIIRSSAEGPAVLPVGVAVAAKPSSGGAITIEAEAPLESNFNLDVFSGLTELSGDGLLGLATQVAPPSPDGYHATYAFTAPAAGTYALRVREGYLAMASPARWRIDDGEWRDAPNTFVPDDIRLAAQYNALEDERMVFAWYDYGQVELSAGSHRLTYSVVAKRPGGADIGLQNSTPYGKLLDCFRLVPVTAGSGGANAVKINLLANPSMEQDTGGWTATEWTGDRWKWFELRDEQGWNRDFWWTRKVGAEGRIFVDKLMDIGGLTVRQSYAGVRSLRVRAGEKPRRFSASPLAVSAGERITFGGYLRVEMLNAKADIRVRFLDADGREVAVEAAPARGGDTHWERVERADVVVPVGSASAVLDCYVGEGKPNVSRAGREWRDTVWFDDLFFYRAR